MVAGGELDPGDPGEPAGQQLLADGGQAGAGSFHLKHPGQVLGRVPYVQPGEVALAVAGLGLLVVEPDGRAEPAGGLGGQRQGVAGGVAEAGGDLAVAGVDGGGEASGAGGLARFGEYLGAAVGVGEAVEDAAVRGGAARNRLDVAEVGMAEAEADRVAGAEPVGGFQDDQAAAGADECGSGAQELVEGGVEIAGAGQALGEFMEGGEVRDHARQPVLDQAARSRYRGRGGGGACGRGRHSVR